LEYLLATLPMSRNKVKDTLQGRGIKVNGKTVTQYDYPLVPGTVVEVSNSKKNDNFKSKYVNLVYEDQYLVVIEKKAWHPVNGSWSLVAECEDRP